MTTTPSTIRRTPPNLGGEAVNQPPAVNVDGGRPEHPAQRLGVDGGSVGHGEPGEGAVDDGYRGGATLGAELGGQPFDGEGAVVAERTKDAA